jgi:hypothetical protein
MEEPKEVNTLIERYIESMADNEMFEIMGLGAFTREELSEHVRDRTSVGVRIARMILTDHRIKKNGSANYLPK